MSMCMPNCIPLALQVAEISAFVHTTATNTGASYVSQHFEYYNITIIKFNSPYLRVKYTNVI